MLELTRPKGICVGIDLHKCTMMIAVLNPDTGEVWFKRIACKNRQQIIDFFKALPRPHTVAIESVGFYRWLWDLLYPITDQLLLADATQARALAGRRLKTDRQDALNVAQLLAAGRLPVAYAPPPEIYELRDWTRQRNFLSRQHARVLHRVKSLMNLNNRPGPARLKAESLIRYLKAQESKLPARHLDQLWMAVDQLTLIERQIAIAERELKRLLALPTFAQTARLLQTMPGVGLVVCATVIAEVGDFSRFTHRKAIARYAGLNPSVYASGGNQRIGHIAKAGPPDLRWAMQQAAWVAIRTDPGIKKLWLKITANAGRKAAAVAIARRMLMWMWYMVIRQQEYRPRLAA